MRALGIVRRLDDLGRIMIPKEIRRNLKLKEGTPLEFYISEKGDIVLKPYESLDIQNEIETIKNCIQNDLEYYDEQDKDNFKAYKNELLHWYSRYKEFIDNKK